MRDRQACIRTSWVVSVTMPLQEYRHKVEFQGRAIRMIIEIKNVSKEGILRNLIKKNKNYFITKRDVGHSAPC